MSSMFVVTSMFDFRASAGILSRYALFPNLVYLKTILVSLIFSGVISMGMFVAAAFMSIVFNEARIFRFSSKFSIHLLPCP